MDFVVRHSFHGVQLFQQEADLFANQSGVGCRVGIEWKLGAIAPIDDEHIGFVGLFSHSSMNPTSSRKHGDTYACQQQEFVFERFDPDTIAVVHEAVHDDSQPARAIHARLVDRLRTVIVRQKLGTVGLLSCEEQEMSVDHFRRLRQLVSGVVVRIVVVEAAEHWIAHCLVGMNARCGRSIQRWRKWNLKSGDDVDGEGIIGHMLDGHETSVNGDNEQSNDHGTEICGKKHDFA